MNTIYKFFATICFLFAGYAYAQETVFYDDYFYMNDLEIYNLIIPPAEIIQGGPPKDGIPSIEKPDFVPASNAKYLRDEDLVIGINYNGTARAYPIRILNYHEIVNDRFDKDRVVVTYSALCGSGLVFMGDSDGKKRTFGVSGLLYNNDVLLYDKQTKSLWSQIMGRSVAGKSSGEFLQQIPSVTTTWKAWRELHPRTEVLTNETGFDFDYTTAPYYIGDEKDPRLLFPVSHSSKLLPAKEKVVGLRIGNTTKAYALQSLPATASSVQDEIEGQLYTVEYQKDNKLLRIFDAAGQEMPTVSLYWFAWYAFHPETALYQHQPLPADAITSIGSR